ncbi:MAG: TonB-dependent receptor [Acidobacteriia bacterium]|nr:TonB-dependent receptor [Terriglobia bacterium]
MSDPAGAVVANVPIELKNTQNGTVYQAASSETGNYTLPQIQIGTYELTISAAGFKKFVRQNITVQATQTVRIDAVLEVGSAAESVTVSAETSLLKTETADVSHNVTNEMLNTLPMLGVGSAASGSSGIRNPNNVLEVIPGTYYAPNSQVKINGAPSNSQAYHVEGMDTTNQGFPYAAAQVQQSVDSIQEISVQTSNFAPEFGAAGGGFFNVTMRSGGNQYHGTAYDYLVNEALNAGTPFTDAGATNSLKAGQLVRPPARRNDYGWTIGGPISIPKVYDGHNKTFFFFNFEQFRETQTINNIKVTVPIDAYRQGDFSQAISSLKVGGQLLTLPGGGGSTDVLGRTLIANTVYNPASVRVLPSGQTVSDPFVGNIIPLTQQDKVALNVQKVIPEPNLPGLINNYLPTYPSTRHSTIPAVKLDQNIGSRAKLSFYWSETQTNSAYSPTYGASEGFPDQITATRGTFIHSNVERLNYDQTLSPTLLLHLGAGYQVNNFYDAAPITNFNAAATWGLVGATLNRNVPVFTGICTGACTAAGGIGTMGPSAGQSNDYWEKPSFNASVTWVKQNHTFKLGGELYINGTPSTSYTGTSGTFNFTANQTALPYLVGTTLSGGSLGFPYASFLMGSVDNYSIAQPASFRFGKKQLAFFLQDSWKVSRKLTIDYGVRWDYGTYYKEQFGRGMGFSPTTPNPSAGGYPGAWIFEATCKCNFASNYPYAVGPRIGLAYQITPKTVFRAGWGIVYNATSTNNAGVNTAGIAPSNAVGNSGLGQAALTLANGIPVSAIPAFPNFNPGIAPLLPIGNQGTPVLGVGGFSNAGLIDAGIARPARQNQWSFGIQREILRNLALEVSYVGNRGVWWNAGGLVNVNALTPQRLLAEGIDVNNPTQLGLLTQQLGSSAVQAAGFRAPYTGFSNSQTLAQALRPFPQFGTINAIGSPLGKTWYDSLQAKATQRFSHGLTFTSAFTWQKNLQQGVDSNAVLNNIVANPANSKSLSSFDQPFTFVISASYTTPKLNINKALAYAARDWNIGSILQYASGLPIATPTTASTLNSQLFQNTLANRVAGQPLYATTWVDRNGQTQTTPLDINCKCFDPAKTFALNPAAWANPANGQFSNSAEFYSDFRYQRHPNESIGLGRTFKFTERMNLMVRVDFSNVFNRTYLNNPLNTGYLSPQSKSAATGLNTGGFGYINLATTGTQFGQPRNGTLVARLTF